MDTRILVYARIMCHFCIEGVIQVEPPISCYHCDGRARKRGGG